jgi:DnaK suppressor protein
MGEQVDLERMKKRLSKQEGVLRRQIDEEKRKTEPSTLANPDRADLAMDYSYRSRRLSLLENLEHQFKEVVAAVNRLEEGVYGVCTNCGRQIQRGRLESVPYASLCIECQRKETVR